MLLKSHEKKQQLFVQEYRMVHRQVLTCMLILQLLTTLAVYVKPSTAAERRPHTNTEQNSSTTAPENCRDKERGA